MSTPTNETSQPSKAAVVQPTWTDACRAVFRVGARRMSLREFLDTFSSLFHELEHRCSDSDCFASNIFGSLRELHACGFLDQATMVSFVKEAKAEAEKR